MASDKVRSYGSGTYYEKKGSPNFYWAFTYEGRQYGNKSTGIRVSTKRAAINEVEAFVAARVAEIKAGYLLHSDHRRHGRPYGRAVPRRPPKRTQGSNARSQLRLLRKRFEDRSVNSLTTLDFKEYREDREDSGICPRTVNRELAYLRAAMNYGHDQFTPRLVDEVPKFPMESEAGNAREGFLEPEGYERLLPSCRHRCGRSWWSATTSAPAAARC